MERPVRPSALVSTGDLEEDRPKESIVLRSATVAMLVISAWGESRRRDCLALIEVMGWRAPVMVQECYRD